MNQYTIKIRRQSSAKSEPYWQSFSFEGTGEETISSVLRSLNLRDELLDAQGHPAERIAWECSCQEGVCGACAMVINGIPALACKMKLRQCGKACIVLEPLSKFPMIRDLRVDRRALYEIPVAHGLWNEGAVRDDAKEYPLQYAAAKCLKCGLCLEVCPNTGLDAKNLGAVFAVECYTQHTQSGSAAEKKAAVKEYRKNFGNMCSKSLSCAAVCPVGIDIKSILCYMNRK